MREFECKHQESDNIFVIGCLFFFKLRSKLIFLLAKLHIYKCKNALMKPSLASFICEIKKSEPLKNSTNLKVITIWNLF